MGKMGCDSDNKNDKNTKLLGVYVPGGKLTIL